MHLAPCAGVIPSSTSQTFSTTDLEPHAPPRSQTQQRSIEHVLVCLDGSPRSEVVLPHAVLLASTFDAKVTLLHVMQPRGTVVSPTDAFGWEFARQRAQGYLEGIRARMQASGVTSETSIAEGNPAQRIAALANEIRADVIVLSRHGEGGSSDFEIGSTAQQVLTIAPVSVLVTRASLESQPSSIVVPLDGSARTECVLPTAVHLARRHRASLTLVHVVTEPVRSSILSDEDLKLARTLAERLEGGAQVYLDHVKQQISHQLPDGVRTVVLRDEHVADALLDFAAREAADLVVIAAHGTTCNPARRFGGTSAFLLAHALPATLMIQDVVKHAPLRHDAGPSMGGAAPRAPHQPPRVVQA